MKKKFAGRLNILCALIYSLLYLGFLFSLIMSIMQGKGAVDSLEALFFTILAAIPCLPVMIPAFFMLVVGREMCSNRETMNRERLLIGITIFIKILLMVIFLGLGVALLLGGGTYFFTYSICMLASTPILLVSWIVDIISLIQDGRRTNYEESV